MKYLKLDWTEFDGGEKIFLKVTLYDGHALLKQADLGQVTDEVDGYQQIIEWLGFPLEEIWQITGDYD